MLTVALREKTVASTVGNVLVALLANGLGLIISGLHGRASHACLSLDGMQFESALHDALIDESIVMIMMTLIMLLLLPTRLCRCSTLMV